MDLNDIIAMIKRHEGYRGYVYIDTEGIPTGGWGHAFHAGSRITESVAEQFLDQDVAMAIDDYDSMKLDLDVVRRAVLIDMLFNLGLPKLREFEKFLAALGKRDYRTAKIEMLDSKWAGQVGRRAFELAEMMETGKKK